MEPDGSLVTHADLSALSEHGWNEIVVDGRGNVYVNGAGFDLMAGERAAPGIDRPAHARRLGAAGGGRARLPERHGGDARQLDADRRRVLRQGS